MRFKTNHPIEHYHRAFKYFLKLEARQQAIENRRPKGRFGILCDKDELALKYQAKYYSYHLLKAFLSGEEYPNPYHARWLTLQEQKEIVDSLK